MKNQRLKLDPFLREKFTYQDDSFPLGVWQDQFDQENGTALEYHWHDAMEFTLVTSGTVDIQLNKQTSRLHSGECVFINANTLHAISLNDQVEQASILTVAFSPTILTGGIQGRLFNKYIQPLNTTNIVGSVFNSEKKETARLHNLMTKLAAIDTTVVGYELEQLSLTSLLWKQLFQSFTTERFIAQPPNEEKYEQQIKRTIQYIQNNYMAKITIESLCQANGLSRSECFRLFKRFTDKKPIEYVNDYRMTIAVNLLLNTHWTIDKIAQQSGFQSASYFGKLFKEQFNKTPRSYRIHHSQKEETSLE